MDVIVGIAFLYLIVILVLDFFGVSSDESTETTNKAEQSIARQLD